MSKVLVVIGASGNQGGSVASYVLNDPELSKQFKIRALSRDPGSSAMRSLEMQGAEVVQADVNDKASLRLAFTGAHTLFALGAPERGPDGPAKEVAQGKMIADVAVAEGVKYMIYSTLPHVTTISNGKYTKVGGFDAKAKVEEYIRKLPIRSAFFAPGSFMQNWHNIMKPRRALDGTYPIERHVSPKTQLPLIEIEADTGKYVGAILAEPDKYEGKTFCAATRLYTMEEIAQVMSKATGKAVVYRQITEEEHLKRLPPWGAMLVEMMSYQQDFGYYGPQTEERVKWSAENARGKLTNFDEYLTKHPLDLE